MKDIYNAEDFTDKEWEELASYLSDENNIPTIHINRFLDEDTLNTVTRWKELKKLSNDREINVDNAWNNVNSRIKSNSHFISTEEVRIPVFRRTAFRVAAVLLLLISIGTAAFFLFNQGSFSKKIMVATNNDNKNLLVDLPDGSKIFLNRNSELIYHSSFGKHNRRVKLKGEAFFEIAEDESNPFIVDAGNASVKVVGTSFNVITNNSESAVEVYVKTGKVILSDNSGSQSILLDPEYVGTIHAKKTEKTINNNPNYLSWNTGLLQYDGQKLDIVFHDLKRVYNMDIVADDPLILENTWTSPIDNQSQETIIRLICASFNLSYSKDGAVYHLSKK
jgi:ferric-dicitrate binding protein FerR (iron transport regulator)